MSDNFWKGLSDRYAKEDWAKVPSIFARQIYEYIPASSKILELACGQGQDGLWFASEITDSSVLATDVEQSAINNARERRDELGLKNIEFEKLDFSAAFSYENESFDVVYSHLGLHYFEREKTAEIFSEIFRVLRPGGAVAFLVNSKTDPEYNTGVKIEADYFETEGTQKRYFDVESARSFARDFEEILCDDQGESYKDTAKGVHNLIRYVGKKPQ